MTLTTRQAFAVHVATRVALHVGPWLGMPHLVGCVRGSVGGALLQYDANVERIHRAEMVRELGVLP